MFTKKKVTNCKVLVVEVHPKYLVVAPIGPTGNPIKSNNRGQPQAWRVQHSQFKRATQPVAPETIANTVVGSEGTLTIGFNEATLAFSPQPSQPRGNDFDQVDTRYLSSGPSLGDNDNEPRGCNFGRKRLRDNPDLVDAPKIENPVAKQQRPRHPEEQQESALSLPKLIVLEIPFKDAHTWAHWTPKAYDANNKKRTDAPAFVVFEINGEVVRFDWDGLTLVARKMHNTPSVHNVMTQLGKNRFITTVRRSSTEAENIYVTFDRPIAGWRCGGAWSTSWSSTGENDIRQLSQTVPPARHGAILQMPKFKLK